MTRIRPEWTTDGMIAVHSGAAAIDLHGDGGEIEQAVVVHGEVMSCVRRVWRIDDFQAQIRLTALLLGQLAVGLPGVAPDRQDALLQQAEDLVARAEHANGMGRRRRRGLESNAWLLRLRAERLRLRWAVGLEVDPEQHAASWAAATTAFAAYGHRYEEARSAGRYAAALRGTPEAGRSTAVAAAALETAHQLGAAPLVAELRPLDRTSPRTAAVGALEVLTPREREVIALVADGRSNREIGERLFVSTKTASVHVSNILAKLSVHTRTEAAAVARRRGLVD